jgi:hypothetical protein
MAAGNTYEAIATQTLGSAAASVTFSSIPSTYTDLVLVAAGSMTTGGATGLSLQFNGDTGLNYSKTEVLGDGSTATSSRSSGFGSMNIGLIDSTAQCNSIFQIMNYANTTTYKTALARGNNASGYVRAGVGLWSSTAAITSVTVLPPYNFATGSTFSLYGIKSA